MNKSLTRFFIEVSWIFLLLVPACTSVEAPVPTELPTTLPATATIQIATEIPSVTPTQHLAVDVTPFPLSSDYITYGKLSTENDRSIWTWAINSAQPTPILISKRVYPSERSPSNKLWLLTGNQSIYIADADGSNVRMIYHSEEYEFFNPFWLTDDVVLFNAFKDYFFVAPDIYSLNINTGTVTRLFGSESEYFIECTFPSEKKWIRGSWSQPTTEIVSENGKAEEFFAGFSVVTDPFSTGVRIQQVRKLDKYLFIAKKQGESNYKLWLAAEEEIPLVFFDPRNDGIDRFAVSPDERYVALAYNTLKGELLYILSLENHKLIYKWVYPHTLSNIKFFWSPDSQSIAFQYYEHTTNGVEEGIKIMDIKTGQTTVISKDDVLEILDWRLVK
jgi:hypothetical protein